MSSRNPHKLMLGSGFARGVAQWIYDWFPDSAGLTASKVLVTDADGRVGVSTMTAAEAPAVGALGNSLAVVTDSGGAPVGSATTAAQIAYLTSLGGTASRAVVTDANGKLDEATTTAAEIGYVNGVTSPIQTQLDAKRSATAIGWRLDKNASDQLNVGTGEATITWSSASSLAFVAGVTFDGVAESITILTAGKYTIGAQIHFAVNNDQDSLVAVINVNGTDVASHFTRAAHSGSHSVNVITELNLAVNDVIIVEGANATLADTVTGLARVTFFWGVFHGT